MGTVFSISISCDNLFSRCLDCISGHPNYAFELGDKLDLLRNDWDELKRSMDDINGRVQVEEERDPLMKRLKVVDGWLLRVKGMEAEIEKLIKDSSPESVNKCLGGYCPKNCKTSYKLGRRIGKKQQEVSVLLSKKSFGVVTDRISLSQIDERPAEVTMSLESTFDEVGSCIGDDQVGILGIYGMKRLTDEVAWNLFQKEVGEEALQAHSEIPELAKVVAKQCGGFPLALITIGRAMASKMIPQAWHHAIELLKGYTSKFTGMEKVFSLLKFSYDSLPNDAIRSCFLYCSLYPEDYEISKKQLIDYWICEDFLVNDLTKARNEGYNYISTLVHASLLEECSPDKVKMYDVIRDMAIWIACDCGAKKDKFFVQARAGLWKGAERVSLMHNKIAKLTGTRNCPNLLTLFLNNNNCESITGGFFQYMPNLRVLNLSDNRRCTSIPKEICELVTLQYLDLSGTSIQELPTEFQNLINLKYLNLSYTRIRIIREGVLSSFKKLQMLKLLWLELGWGASILMKEMESLEYLNDLAITIESDFGLSDILSSQKLIRITTALTLLQLDMLVLKEMRHCTGTRYIEMLVFKEMRHLENLEIFYCESLEEFRMGKEGKASFLNIINHNYFPQLRTLLIGNCHKLKDITWLAFAPNLEEIGIVRCSGMEEVVGGWKWDEEEEEDGDDQQINMEIIIPFANLTRLLLDGLPELTSIYPTTLPFPCLKDLRVIDCPKLKKLPLNSSSCKSGGNIITIWGKKKWWKGFEWENKATRLAFQSSFKRNPW